MSDKTSTPAPGQPVPARVRFANANELVAKFLENPDLGGIVIPTHVPVPTGTKLDLTIDLGGGKGIKAVGQVAWFRAPEGSSPGGLGVRFVEMAQAHRDWLAQAVASAKPKAEPAGDEKHVLRKAVSGRDIQGSHEDLAQVHIDDSGGRVMGVDLGTCNCSACVYVDGKPIIINLADDDAPTGSARTLASVVGYDEGGRATIGAKAAEALPRNPKRTIFGAKRFIGRTYDSPAVQSLLARFPYKVVPGSEGRVAIDINGKAINLTSISAKILQAIREKASKELGEPVSRAVITVPAYYNDNQRNAVVQAGRLAGLTVERILNEPTAAAIAYGLLRSKPRRLLVYDLGGGTFDVSVMSVHKEQLQVLATAGDTFLGGEDFDEILVKYAYEQYFAKHKKPLSQAPGTMGVIKQAAEAAKRRLSGKDSVINRKS
ncbi:MAG TPA: Hsp70 family protein, partial [Myxococcota bacterium]|nr:Hsp70 family protein [Myxococcota bacterium]